MNKSYITAALFTFLVSILIYNILEDNRRVNSFFDFHKNISEIIIVNNDLNRFIDSTISYKNFDFLKNSILKIDQNLQNIENSEMFLALQRKILQKRFIELRKILEEKIILIERLKSHSAVLNNSLRNVMKIASKIENEDYIELYISILSLNVNPEISYELLLSKSKNLKPNSKYEKLFMIHINLLLNRIKIYDELKIQVKNLDFNEKLENFEKKYANAVHNVIANVKNTILILVSILALVIFSFLVYSHKILKERLEFKRFKNAVENSDNFVVVTDYDKKIKYMNSSMLSTMGYSLDEVLGKNPSIFKAGVLTQSSYKRMNKTIYSGKKWTGEFVNKTKDGKIVYEKASITPIMDDKGKISEFLAIKLDISKEKEVLNMLKEKDHKLTQQAKLVVMNEILNSIAHQWRQPLSIISTATSGLCIYKENGVLDDDKFKELTDSIMSNTEYLSNTIENFKSFFKTGNEVSYFDLKESFNKAYKLIEYKIENDDILYNFNFTGDIKLKGIENDLIQVFVNIINNSIEVLENKSEKGKYIFVDVALKNKLVIIRIKDNGNGMNDKNFEKIFQPYFTTKHSSQGTGMGLYMSHEIISKQFKGKVTMKNISYEYNNCKQKGLETKIVLPSNTKDSINDLRPTV